MSFINTFIYTNKKVVNQVVYKTEKKASIILQKQLGTPDNTLFFRGLIENAFTTSIDFIKAQKFYNIHALPNTVIVISGFYTLQTKNRPHPTQQIKEICAFFLHPDELYIIENGQNLILFYKIPPRYQSAKDFFYTTQFLEKIVVILKANAISIRIGVSQIANNPMKLHHSFTEALFSNNNQLHALKPYQFYDDFTKNEHIRTVLTYLELNLNQNISIKEITSKINFSTSYFHKLFKREMNQTFLEYMTFKKIHVLREEVLTGLISFEQLAIKYNYNSVSYFALTFKKQLGITPGEYRKVKPLVF